MKLKTILIAMLGTSALVAAPAFADRGHGRGHGHGHGHHFKHHSHHQHHRPHFSHYHRPVVVVPPRVVYRAPAYYAPAPVYYAPAPVYRHAPAYDSGSVSIRFSLPL